MKQILKPYLLKCAYLAGFFDGEGCIFVQKNSSMYKRKDGSINTSTCGLNLLVSVAQNDIKPLLMFKKYFGGNILSTKSKPGSFNWYPMKEINSIKLLKAMLPFLIVKKKQAKLAIQFHEKKIIKKKVSIRIRGKLCDNKELQKIALQIKNDKYLYKDNF